ncbi:hypothetical protein B0H14DRAFT_2585317 [Mycena olivaceomarginata]|nr:hypothetical protein B0H14DRAFT_2585317 [Mycena olivaceomarginata]
MALSRPLEGGCGVTQWADSKWGWAGEAAGGGLAAINRRQWQRVSLAGGESGRRRHQIWGIIRRAGRIANRVREGGLGAGPSRVMVREIRTLLNGSAPGVGRDIACTGSGAEFRRARGGGSRLERASAAKVIRCRRVARRRGRDETRREWPLESGRRGGRGVGRGRAADGTGDAPIKFDPKFWAINWRARRGKKEGAVRWHVDQLRHPDHMSEEREGVMGGR